MNARGDYRYLGQAKAVRKLDHSAVRLGPAEAVWRFGVLEPTELAWWLDTALGGAQSASGAVSLWVNNTREVVAPFTSGTLFRPEFSGPHYRFGRYWDIEIRFSFLLPLPTIGLWTVGTSLVAGLDVLR